jgi:hypothetical protein
VTPPVAGLHGVRLYFAATRLAISHIIVTPRRTFSTDIRSLFPWIVLRATQAFAQVSYRP